MGSIQLRDVTKVYRTPGRDPVKALDQVNLSVNSGELLAIVGPSASGKTTLLRLIAGLEDVTSGTIEIGGKPVNAVPPQDRDVAMVFQHYALYPHMTAYENIAFGLKVRKLPKAEIVKRVMEAAKMLGLENCLDARPESLSGGQRQRVALGRAIVRQSGTCLLDEPLSNLDPEMRNQVRAEIARIHRRLGLTLLYVTHDQSEAMALGQRVAVIKGGTIQQIGEPMEIYNSPRNVFVAGFVGSPRMNFLAGVLVQKAERMVFELENSAAGDPLILSLPAQFNGKAGQKVILGIRPEHILLQEGIALDHSEIFATVEVSERLGSHTELHLAGAGLSFQARVPGNGPGLKEQVPVSLQMNHALFFDATTRERLD